MIMKIIKALWIGVAVLVLSVTLYSYDGKAYSDIWVFSTWLMLFLSFPAGLLVSVVHMALGSVFSVTVETSYLSLTLEWVVYFVLGYVQWFILLPYFITKLKGAKKISTGSSLAK